MRTLHRITAILLLAFIVTHIGNHVAAAFGVKAYNSYLATARLIYRHPVIEPTLIILIIAQAVTGVRLIINSFQVRQKRSLIAWLELLSIIIFVFFITIHLSAIVVTRFYFEIQTDFYWVAEMFRKSPLQPYILIFHFLGVVAIAIHAGIGVKYMFRSAGHEKFGHAAALVFILSGFVAATIAIAAYSGVFYSISLTG